MVVDTLDMAFIMRLELEHTIHQKESSWIQMDVIRLLTFVFHKQKLVDKNTRQENPGNR